MDQSKYITCKGCGLKREYILMHFAKDRSKDCKNSYTKEELSFLKKESKRRSDEKSKEKKKLNYDSAKRADRYQKVKEKIAKKYDSLQSLEKFFLLSLLSLVSLPILKRPNICSCIL